MTNDENDAVIVRSTIDLGRNLGLEVVAEGVENAEAWRNLELYGCDIAQGYYLSRPVPADELTAWLKETGGLVHEPQILAVGASAPA
jgi:EAL domain-containing protein (putative c-di-GMP-specific phosphodiesterase class I)